MQSSRQEKERTSACGPIWGTVVSAPTFLNSSNAAAVLEYYIAALSLFLRSSPLGLLTPLFYCRVSERIREPTSANERAIPLILAFLPSSPNPPTLLCATKRGQRSELASEVISFCVAAAADAAMSTFAVGVESYIMRYTIFRRSRSDHHTAHEYDPRPLAAPDLEIVKVDSQSYDPIQNVHPQISDSGKEMRLPCLLDPGLC